MSNAARQSLIWVAASTGLYLLFRIWQEVRREGTETIVILDRVGDDDDDPDYSQWPAGLSLPNGRGKQGNDPLAN